MKQTFLIACAAVLLSGCQKLLNYYNVDAQGKPHVKPRPHCRLISETNPQDPEVDRTLYTYDEQGRPSEISFPYPDEEQYVKFEYDDAGRLAYEWVSTYIGPGNRKYVYEGESRMPIRDTLYRWYDLVYTESFTYDNNGRIIREDIRMVSAPDDYEDIFGDPREWETTHIYYYDLRGNRQATPADYAQVVTGTVEYSDRPNPYSLNPAFQLYNRDFSRNTPSWYDKEVATYNEVGLPLTFKHTPRVMAYDCDE
jgi:YD repeat-containing protein